MEKLREAISGKNRWDGLITYILLIEQNKASNPNVALDGAKSILESVSKTILADKGIAYNTDDSIGHLIKQAFNSLPVFSKLSTEDSTRARSILGSFENISKTIGDFRNTHGFFSHGHDLESAKFDRYLIELSISSSDLLTSFLIISHAEDLKDRSRLYYEEHEDFNNYIDDASEQYPVVATIQLSPSKSLFTDEDAYRELWLGFESNKEAAINKLEKSGHFITTHTAIGELEEFTNYLSDAEITRILEATVQNEQIYFIIKDGDVKEFIGALFESKEANISPELKAQLEGLLA